MVPPGNGSITAGRFEILELQAFGNVRSREDQGFSGHPDDGFVGTTAGRGWQFRLGPAGDVDADDGKIAILQFKNVRAAAAPGRFRAPGVGIRSKSS